MIRGFEMFSGRTLKTRSLRRLSDEAVQRSKAKSCKSVKLGKKET